MLFNNNNNNDVLKHYDKSKNIYFCMKQNTFSIKCAHSYCFPTLAKANGGYKVAIVRFWYFVAQRDFLFRNIPQS